MQKKKRNASAAVSHLGKRLLILNNRIPLTQKNLAGLVGVSSAAVRNWMSGRSLLNAHHLQQLIEIYTRRGAFVAGKEQIEAEELWQLAQERGLKTPFDEQWFKSLQENLCEQLQAEKQEEQESAIQNLDVDRATGQAVTEDTIPSSTLLPGVRDASNELDTRNSRDKRSLWFARIVSRRTALASLASFVAGGTIGSGLTWAAFHSTSQHKQLAWNVTANMLVSRCAFRATTLNTGIVLVEGGYTATGSYTADSERYDPATGVWTRTRGTLNEERSEHEATLMSNGKVLVTGGFANGVTRTSAEIYDPVHDMWTLSKSNMSTSRTRHTSTLLQDGRVLIVGGVHHDTAELYDPVVDSWSPAGHMAIQRSDHVAVHLLDGKVLVAGGTIKNDGHSVTNKAEMYDPVTNTWTLLPDMKLARAYFTAVLLPNGKVMVIGGRTNTFDLTPTTEVFDPISRIWSIGDSMQYSRQNALGQDALLLENGLVIVAGGDLQGTSEIYSPTLEKWIGSFKLSASYYFGVTTLLDKGRVLVAGGYTIAFTDDNRHITPTAEIYSPAVG